MSWSYSSKTRCDPIPEARTLIDRAKVDVRSFGHAIPKQPRVSTGRRGTVSIGLQISGTVPMVSCTIVGDQVEQEVWIRPKSGCEVSSLEEDFRAFLARSADTIVDSVTFRLPAEFFGIRRLFSAQPGVGGRVLAVSFKDQDTDHLSVTFTNVSPNGRARHLLGRQQMEVTVMSPERLLLCQRRVQLLRKRCQPLPMIALLTEGSLDQVGLKLLDMEQLNQFEASLSWQLEQRLTVVGLLAVLAQVQPPNYKRALQRWLEDGGCTLRFSVNRAETLLRALVLQDFTLNGKLRSRSLVPERIDELAKVFEDVLAKMRARIARRVQRINDSGDD